MDNEQQLEQIKSDIRHRLDGFPNFAGVEFWRTINNGLRIVGKHAYLTPKYGYTYPEFQPVLKADLSNKEEAIYAFVEAWERYDTPEEVKRAEEMYIDFARYGTE